MNDLEHVVLPPVPIPSCSSSSSTGATSLHEDSKQILKRDYRPAWLIASALSLASSNENREKAESKLLSIKETTVGLEDRLIQCGVKSMISNVQAEIKEETEQWSSVSSSSSTRRGIPLNCDVFTLLMENLTLIDIMNLETTCKEVRKISFECHFWTNLIKRLYPSLCADMIDSECSSTAWVCTARDFVISRAKTESQCIRFVRTMKRERAVPRHNSVNPRRYTKSEKSVTHPMPVFEGFKSNKMMSTSDTMDRDFRLEALSALISKFLLFISHYFLLLLQDIMHPSDITLNVCRYVQFN